VASNALIWGNAWWLGQCSVMSLSAVVAGEISVHAQHRSMPAGQNLWPVLAGGSQVQLGKN
jgi:hypothetical protein